jgi:hypothetical protein
MKKYIYQILAVLVAFSANATMETKSYSNNKGCFAEVEVHSLSKAVYLTIQKNNEVVATSSVIYRHDLKYGDVGSFCKSAVVTKKGDIVNVFCGPQADPEGYTTRGSATVDFTNGLASIQVRGEHLDSGKWIVDINQKCDQMEPVP